MKFRKLPRSQRPPDGYRLACVQDVIKNAETIRQEGIFTQRRALRLLDGWVNGDLRPEVGFRKHTDYMLVVEAENSGSGGRFRKKLYSAITLSNEGREAALLLSCEDENTEVIYWLLLEIIGRKDESDRLRNAFDNTFREKMRKGYLQAVDGLLALAVRVAENDIDWKTELHSALKFQRVVDQLIFAELIFERCNSAQQTHGKGRRHSDTSEKVDDDTANMDLQCLVKEALVKGHIEMVYDLLELGSSLTPQPDIAHGTDGKTLLHYAAEFGDGTNALNVIKLLVEKYYVGEEFVRKEDEYGTTVLHLASLFGHTDLFEYLIIRDHLFGKESLEKVTDKYGQNPLHYAAKGGSEEIVDILLKETFSGGEEIDDILLKETFRMRGSTDEKGKTPLHVASEEGHGKIVKKLLLSKSEGVEDYARQTDSFGQTALHKAASRGHSRIVKRLLKIMNGYRPDWDNAGRTSLHFAVLLEDETTANEITKMLLDDCGDETHKYLLLCSSAVGIGNVVQSAKSNKHSLGKLRKTIEESLIKQLGVRKIYFMRRALSDSIEDGSTRLLTDLFDENNTDVLEEAGTIFQNVSRRQEGLDGPAAIDSLLGRIIEASQKQEWVIQDFVKRFEEAYRKQEEAYRKQALDAPTIAPSGIANFAAGIAALFLSPYVKSPITVGILGKWGMGKSSVMLQTERILLQTAAFPHFLPAESLPEAEEIVPNKKWRKLYKMIVQEVNKAKVEGDAQVEFLPVELYRSKYHGILKSLASMDRSHMFRMYDTGKNSFSNYRRGHMNILTVFYNAWHYRDEHEAWAGLAVEITKEIESAMTIAQWMSTCWRYASTRERQSFYLQLILPSLIATIIAVGVVVVAWILLSTSHNKQLSGFIRYGSIPATLVGIAWVVMKSAFSVLKPVSSQMAGYMRFPDHTARLGYQQKVIDDINFLKEEIGQEPKLFCSLIAHTCWPWNWFGLCENNVAGTAIPRVRPAPREKLRIVVFVDDLDRCQDSVILKVLSATNLVLAACEIDVVLGIDNKMIERAVKKEFADIGERNEIKEDSTENYMRKIIHIPLVLSHRSDLALRQLGGFKDSTPGEAKERSSRTGNVASSDNDASQERSTSDASPAKSGECGVNIEGDDAATITRHNTSLKTKIRGLVYNTISSCFHYLKNIQQGLTWSSKSEPEWNGDALPWHGEELAGQRLRFTYSNEERKALLYMWQEAKSDRQPPRERREFENYHFVARNILSKEPELKVMEEWELQLIIWISCCWQWRRQINTIIQDWDELVQAAVSNGRQPETRNRNYGPSLLEIVACHINKRLAWKQNPRNENVLAQIESTMAVDVRFSKLLEEDVYVQGRESKEQHVDWAKAEMLWEQQERQQAWLRSIKEARAKEQEEQKAWLSLKDVLTRYDVSMEGIQYFQGFRFHCNAGHLSWKPQWQQT